MCYCCCYCEDGGWAMKCYIWMWECWVNAACWTIAVAVAAAVVACWWVTFGRASWATCPGRSRAAGGDFGGDVMWLRAIMRMPCYGASWPPTSAGRPWIADYAAAADADFVAAVAAAMCMACMVSFLPRWAMIGDRRNKKKANVTN